MENTCPNYEKCPIYSGLLQDKDTIAQAYRNQYCDSGDVNWNRCKRYITKQKYGKCPPELLPNSSLSIEEIGRRYFEI